MFLECILLQLFFVTNCGTWNTISFEKCFVFLHQYFPKYVYNVTYDSYVYWAVHLLDSWKRKTNLMSLALLFHYLMLNMFRMLIHPSSGACDLFVGLFHELYCSGSIGVGVALWFGCGGVVSVCRLRHCLSLHTDTTPEQYNPWNNSTNKSQAPELDVLTSEICWVLNNEIVKQVTSSWSLFIQLLNMTVFLVPLYHSCQVCCSGSFWKKFINTISVVLIITLLIFLTFYVPCVSTVKSSYFKMCTGNYYYHYYYYYCYFPDFSVRKLAGYAARLLSRIS